MLMRVWYPITVATQSWHLKQRIYQSLCRTADDPDGEINFKLHDFGARGFLVVNHPALADWLTWLISKVLTQ
ncbi:hypothetical protein NON20_05520 [Synechocystis sp. B12]|nr:hypothetical protein NON20_05520 [Synechocystis sp. B12]